MYYLPLLFARAIRRLCKVCLGDNVVIPYSTAHAWSSTTWVGFFIENVPLSKIFRNNCFHFKDLFEVSSVSVFLSISFFFLSILI